MNQPTFLRKIFNPRLWGYGLFWSWNLIFLAFVLLGFAPRLLPEMLQAVRADEIPTAFLAYAVILTLIPVAAVSLGLTVLRRSPGRLFVLGYGVEGPLMLMVGIRFFAVREMTAAVGLLMALAGLGLATLLWQILDQQIDRRGPLLTYIRVIGLTILLLIGLYGGLWVAFYALPASVFGLRALGDLIVNLPEALANFWHNLFELEWLWLPFALLGSILLVYSGTLFVLMPIAVPVLCIRAWWRGVRALAAKQGLVPAVVLTMLVVVIAGAAVVRLNRQPQHEAFALLANTPTSPAEAEALLARQDDIRAGLVNAYLAPFRYFSSVGEVRHVANMYEDTFKLSRDQAESVQHLYELVARPVLYEPVEPVTSKTFNWNDQVFLTEPDRAAELYANFFDQPIADAERESIVRAVRTTWSVDQAAAAWRTVDDREVHLLRQEVTVEEQGDWAEVELYEVYQNQTNQRQEVVYYFSLPESAAITGVWLGNSADRAERFTYQVAPRGAAQAVYRNEIRRRMDPALVEQIGPRQYRLRVFPVQPEQWQRGGDTERLVVEAAPPLHMWLTYRVMAEANGWALPHLAEKRNVYWDDDSIRLINGQAMTVADDAWLPAAVPATGEITPVTHRVDFPGGQSVLVRAATADEAPDLPSDLRLAVVLDRSRSMAGYTAEVEAALDGLAGLAEAESAVDVYLTASEFRGEAPSRTTLAELNIDDIVYFGGQNAATLLAQFNELQRGESYDAVFVLTDGSGYELGDSEAAITPPDAPVWLVHLNGDISLGYDDATLAAIQASGGGVAGSIEEAMTRLAVSRAGQAGIFVSETGGPGSFDLIDGYAWLAIPTATADALSIKVVTHPAGDPFAALAARRLILAEMHQQRVWLSNLETLDNLHALAVDNSIVTPYSSMIVLVNQQQRTLLKQLENGQGRFDREFEDVGETEELSPFAVTGVPEPEEWLLIILAVAMLAWYWSNKRREGHGARPSASP
ncbi:MAG: TIGR02921 family PEP-CTERM protein [Anaerolineales bacterium]|nr:TIGR02921 family PEP-CTERM protein [Anaerolineales bacterium]